MTFEFNIVESISKTLVIYCDNAVIVYFFQTIKNKSFGRTNYLIQKIGLLERRYISIIYVITNCTLVDSLRKGLGVKLFYKQVTKMSLTKPFGIKD